MHRSERPPLQKEPHGGPYSSQIKQNLAKEHTGKQGQGCPFSRREVKIWYMIIPLPKHQICWIIQLEMITLQPSILQLSSSVMSVVRLNLSNILSILAAKTIYDVCVSTCETVRII